MPNISSDPNHFLMDPTQLNHNELREQFVCCLDPLPGSGDCEPNMLTVTKALAYRPAAILVPLLLVNYEWHILMTKRAAHLAHHAGQVSFPGGKMELHDASPVETALREAHEEVKLIPGSVQVAGLLDEVRSPARFLVRPVVGIVCGNNVFESLVADPAEVELMFTLPLTHLRNPDNFRLVQRETDGRRNDYWVVQHDQHYIWGLSARVLNDLHRRFYKAV